ncbi:Protein lin-28 -like protein B [Collichthys lucidus]|uniref:Protein lin-28-like protein B n=1 Tax=Collichthys lucidus TaxID=240159 RepID=A0A4U5UP10_COLLU|nr:Protein lin-28 -like protein B [Collichthys lucidus]
MRAKEREREREREREGGRQREREQYRGGPGKGGGEDPAKSTAEQEDRTRPQILSGSGFCKWFNVRMGFGFISMTSSEGSPVDPPLDVFVHQVS